MTDPSTPAADADNPFYSRNRCRYALQREINKYLTPEAAPAKKKRATEGAEKTRAGLSQNQPKSPPRGVLELVRGARVTRLLTSAADDVVLGVEYTYTQSTGVGNVEKVHKMVYAKSVVLATGGYAAGGNSVLLRE